MKKVKSLYAVASEYVDSLSKDQQWSLLHKVIDIFKSNKIYLPYDGKHYGAYLGEERFLIKDENGNLFDIDEAHSTTGIPCTIDHPSFGKYEDCADYLKSAIVRLKQYDNIDVIEMYKATTEQQQKTSLTEQYDKLKEKHPDAVLLFRTGDYYESYKEDAEICAKTLGITITVRSSDNLKMSGFPYHALDTYLPKLIRAGYRIAICDQIDDNTNKKVVKRG